MLKQQKHTRMRTPYYPFLYLSLNLVCRQVGSYAEVESREGGVGLSSIHGYSRSEGIPGPVAVQARGWNQMSWGGKGLARTGCYDVRMCCETLFVKLKRLDDGGEPCPRNMIQCGRSWVKRYRCRGWEKTWTHVVPSAT